MNTVIFLGPTLPLHEARRILDARYLPPAGQGDLISAVLRYRPTAVGLIDGFFYQSLSVWHKEILDAIDHGVRVYGAASMGAIRAAETARYGAIGVGEIYEGYRSGTLAGDDEVAVAHAGPEEGFRPLSDALVNIRATLASAVTAGVIDHLLANQICDVAKGVYFPQRRLTRIFELAEAAGVEAATINRLRRFVDAGYVDLKRRDAVRLLETLRDSDGSKTGTEAPAQAVRARSVFLEVLRSTDRVVGTENGDVDLASVTRHAALSEPHFEDLVSVARNRRLAVLLAKMTGILPTDAEIEGASQRFRVRFSLESEVDFERWLTDNDITPGEFRDLMHTVACARRLHRWSAYAAPAGWARDVLDEMRLAGGYVTAKREAAAAERDARAVDAEYDRKTRETEDLGDLAEEQALATGWRLDTDVQEWAPEVGFQDRVDFYFALLRASLARRRVEDTDNGGRS